MDLLAIDLPICQVWPAIQQSLLAHPTLVLSAPPGAGKSTLLPLLLLQEPFLQDQKILMLEPRRLAAKSLAQRMSSLLGEPVGQTVGYRVRMDHCVSASTRIEVITEAILVRMLHQDNALEGVGMILFDEFHERNLYSDLSLALATDVQQVLRPDLRLVVMSATLDVAPLCSLLQAPSVVSDGRMFPVAIHYGEGVTPDTLIDQTVKTLRMALHAHAGDVLVFLPGEREILACCERIAAHHPELIVCPLYGALPWREQQQAIVSDANGSRKVVVATSIAETSLTIEGIKIVLDSGYHKTLRYHSTTGISALETEMISQDVATQRAGRAGRTAEGVCYRLWTRASQQQMRPFREPEIEQADLHALALDLALWGIEDPADLLWLSPVPKKAYYEAQTYLHLIGALQNNRISTYGKQLQQFAAHPRTAHMLLQSQDKGLAPLACDVAALLSERDPMQGRSLGVDFCLRVEALHQARRNGLKAGSAFSRIDRLAQSYRKLLAQKDAPTVYHPHQVGDLLASIFPERVARKVAGSVDTYQLSNGTQARLALTDDLLGEEWISIAHLQSNQRMGYIHLASAVDTADLERLMTKREMVAWDSRKKQIVAQRETRIGQLVIHTAALTSVDEQAVIAILCETVSREGETLLSWDEAVLQWQSRVMSLRAWNGPEEFPDVSTENLLRTCEAWLPPYLQSVRTESDLKRLHLPTILLSFLDYEQQQLLDRLAPERLRVPSGSSIALQYHLDGSQPVLSVRIQELFGLPETPAVNTGRNRVLLHLLSPGFKPVQVTSDLTNFWNSTYFEVKKELKRRYPKHVWPDDPWQEQATRHAKSRKS